MKAFISLIENLKYIRCKIESQPKEHWETSRNVATEMIKEVEKFDLELICHPCEKTMKFHRNPITVFGKTSSTEYYQCPECMQTILIKMKS